MLVFVLLLVIVITSAFIGFLQTRVPFVSTSQPDIERLVKELPVTGKDVFYDLGSGDGRVCVWVSGLSGAKSVGYELTWWTYVLAVLRSKFKNQKLKLEFKNKNFFKHNWAEATVIYGYLYPPLMGRVEEKIKTECKPGTTIVIRDFPLPSMVPVTIFNKPLKPSTFVDTKWNRFKLLFQNPFRRQSAISHELYIYKI